MDAKLLAALNAERRARRGAIVLTDLATGEASLIREADDLEGLPRDDLAKAFRSGRSGLIEHDGQSLFVNVHVPPPRIVVIGAVHISQALAPMARLAGFEVEIVDPRTAFATAERFPDIRLEAEWPDAVLARRPLDAYTALVAVTHDPKIDDPPLIASLTAGCFYVGALGSRKTHARRVERLRDAGLGDDRIGSISAPIGLPIAAATPAEIAVAILAEIIAALRNRGQEPGPKDVAA